MDKKSLYALIRDEVIKAAHLEEQKGPFNLSGRGHEPRVTLDRTMAGILRECPIPRVTISGFGANNFYPERIFVTAGRALAARIGLNPLKQYSQGIYLGDIDKLQI
jgi:hypothetical protein